MNNSPKFLTAIVFLVFIVSLTAQDAYFMQYNNAPLTVNPALTGTFEGNHRVLMNYRSQWSGTLGGDSFTTMALSYDSHVELGKTTIIGFGLNGLRDRAGALDLSLTQPSLLLSVSKKLMNETARYHMLSFGIEGGMARRSIDLSTVQWPSQHDGNGGFDPDLPGGNISDGEISHTDLSAGLSWKFVMNSKSFIQLGTALHHINEPDVTFLGTPNNTLSRRTTYHGLAEIAVADFFSFLPSFIYLNQGVHSDLRVGASGKWYYRENTDAKFVQIGFWRRANKNVHHPGSLTTIAASAALDLGHLQLGLTYDREFNNELTLTNASSFELMLGYVFGESKIEE